MKRFVCSLLLLCGFSASCNREDLPDGGRVVEKDGYYTLQVEVSDTQDGSQTYAAGTDNAQVSLHNLTMVVVDTVSEGRPILDTAVMRRVSTGSAAKYTFRIPATVDLAKVRFYTLANVYNEAAKVSNLDLTDIEGSLFGELLRRKVAVPASLDEGVHYDSYLLMNRAGVPLDMQTKTLPPIRVQHLPARVFFNTSSLSGKVTQVRITQVGRTASLQGLYPGSPVAEDGDIYDLEDPDPGMSSSQSNYYYLVYPSGKESQLSLTIEPKPGEPVRQQVVTLGVLESGKNYDVKINALDLSFQGNISNFSVYPGGDSRVVLNVNPGLGTREVTWSSGDESIFTVAKDASAQNEAVVTGLRAGTATLTATCERSSATLQVVVKPQDKVMHMLVHHRSGRYYVRQKGTQKDSTQLTPSHALFERMKLIDSTMYTYDIEGMSHETEVLVAKVSLRTQTTDYISCPLPSKLTWYAWHARLAFAPTHIISRFVLSEGAGIGICKDVCVYDYSGQEIGVYSPPVDWIQDQYGPLTGTTNPIMDYGIWDVCVDETTGKSYFVVFATWENEGNLSKSVNFVYEYKLGENPFASPPVHTFDTGENGAKLELGKAVHLKVIAGDFYIVTSRTVNFSNPDFGPDNFFMGLKNDEILFQEYNARMQSRYRREFNPDFCLHNGKVYVSHVRQPWAKLPVFLLSADIGGALTKQKEYGFDSHVMHLFKDEDELCALVYCRPRGSALYSPSYLYRGWNDPSPMTFQGDVIDVLFE